MSLSLEEQEKILLDRMEENRRNYRNNFIQQFDSAGNSTALPGNSEVLFPRSHTFKLLTHHPYFVGIALFAALAVSRGSFRNILKKNLAFSAGMLANKVKMLVVPAIIRLFRSDTHH